MEPEDFCRWLQGMFDVSKLEELNEEQIAIVRSHLNTVFSDVTGYGMAGIAKKYRAKKAVPDLSWVDPNMQYDAEEEMIDEGEDIESDIGSMLGGDLKSTTFCMQKDDSEQGKSDPNHKENAWKIDPSIKTVLSC